MIKVFCGRRGTGKTKKLLGRANEGLEGSKGDSVYIDVNNKNIHHLKTEIRFINTNELRVRDIEGIYGLICGIIAQNYDVENIYIDNLTNMIDIKAPNTKIIFENLKDLSERFNINILINVDCEECGELTEYINEYAMA